MEGHLTCRTAAGNVDRRRGKSCRCPYLHARQSASPRRSRAAAILGVLSGSDRKPFTHGSGRLELAAAITDQGNPLTARVIVNRVWQQHFGRGLVATASDFGARGDTPTHPALLDYLAATFRDDGWSLKRLHRRLMLSSTYQQDSADRPECVSIDPENRFLWKMNRRRVEFEVVRDSLLAAAGRLDRSLGGKPIPLLSEPYSTRRTIYGFIDRGDLPGLYRAFDFASPEASSPERPRTTVPQQALFVMNSPFVIEQARHLAARPEIAAQTDSSGRVERSIARRWPAVRGTKNSKWRSPSWPPRRRTKRPTSP